MRHTISVLVQNHTGVLARVSGLFSARAYNIESLSVGTTVDPEYSRITIVVSGDDQVLEQVVKQLAKLVEVVKVSDLKPDASVLRELALIKIKAEGNHRLEIFEIANVFRAKVLDVGPATVTAEVTGTHDKVEAFLTLARPHGIVELVRTGVAGLSRGSEVL